MLTAEYFHPFSSQNSSCFTSLPTFGAVVFIFSHSGGYRGVCHYGFNFSPWLLMMSNTFLGLLTFVYHPLSACSDFWQFKIGLFVFIIELQELYLFYILDISLSWLPIHFHRVLFDKQSITFWCSHIYLFFFFIVTAFSVLSKEFWPPLGYEDIVLYFLQEIL